MRYAVESEKTVEEATEALNAAVARHKFGVLHTYDLQETLKNKGFELPHACRILEICNPGQAMKVLSEDMGMNIALPCRVSVYEENGKTVIAMARPTALLTALSDAPALKAVADEVEAAMISMIDEAR
jgi:uncharacterized protein (DUF302 family)